MDGKWKSMRKTINEQNIYEINFILDRNYNNINDEESDSKSMIMDLWQYQPQSKNV